MQEVEKGRKRKNESYYTVRSVIIIRTEISLLSLKSSQFNGYAILLRKARSKNELYIYALLHAYLHSIFQRSRSTDKQRSNQSRVGIFNRVDSRVVQVGQAVSLPLHRPGTYWNRPLVGVR